MPYISQYHGIEWYRPYDTNDWCIVQTDIVKPISIQCVTMRFLNWWYIYNVNHHSLPSEKHRILRFCPSNKSFRPEDKPYSRCLLRTEWTDEFEECASTISHNRRKYTWKHLRLLEKGQCFRDVLAACGHEQEILSLWKI